MARIKIRGLRAPGLHAHWYKNGAEYVVTTRQIDEDSKHPGLIWATARPPLGGKAGFHVSGHPTEEAALLALEEKMRGND